jgi:hypothetical protein
MPEFILDHGTPEASREFNKLDSFTQGYVQALFFTDCEPGTRQAEPDETPDDSDCIWNPETQSSLPGDVSVADLAPVTLARIIADCAAFQTANAALLEQAQELEPGSEGLRYGRDGLNDERLGMLFWYARNGHGVAFTDDGDAPCLQLLQDACGYGTAFPQVDTGLGDDGLIYF